ncbi:MAG: tRNA (N(6)-L-threonylcarbamoyladenosine(37)-C(2))-methylthiotransferase MtaB [Anaerolineae bacterium]|nr:tRNA (N(6)-L-threonylcarbamoyladenosine(37)-C(2))-methylthiotransferase MtaB [Anaerolineae bacterium]
MNVHLRMLGCRLNQAEIERMARQLTAQGHTIVEDPALADQIIVNTCAVTHDAVRGSRKLVRQLHRSSTEAELTVTGCYAQLEPEALRALPGVTRVVGNEDKDQLVSTLTGQPVDAYDQEPIQRETNGVGAGRTRAFVKVQDGCDNACTFCVTTVARGAGRSRPLADVLREVDLLVAMGYQEIVLTGVHLGSYGHDLGDVNGLMHLVQAILAETDAPRLRLSSLEPWDLAPEFFSLWQDARLCRHLHLPLQSGCDATLRRMARRTTQAQFGALVRQARQISDDMCITSDIIVGFPGETNEEFETSLAFVEAMDFAGLHVFRYSKRPGTAAARMRGHVDEATSRERSARMMAHADAQAQRYAERFTGQALDVLWEQVAGATDRGFVNIGYTDNYIRVRCIHPRALTNHIVPAQLDAYDVEQRQMHGTPILD